MGSKRTCRRTDGGNTGFQGSISDCRRGDKLATHSTVRVGRGRVSAGRRCSPGMHARGSEVLGHPSAIDEPWPWAALPHRRGRERSAKVLSPGRSRAARESPRGLAGEPLGGNGGRIPSLRAPAIICQLAFGFSANPALVNRLDLTILHHSGRGLPLVSPASAGTCPACGGLFFAPGAASSACWGVWKRPPVGCGMPPRHPIPSALRVLAAE